jgi:hypothetical protein
MWQPANTKFKTSLPETFRGDTSISGIDCRSGAWQKLRLAKEFDAALGCAGVLANNCWQIGKGG